MNHASTHRALLTILSILVYGPAWGQACSPTDPVLLSALRDREDFVSYVCPVAGFACRTEQLSALIETTALDLFPPAMPPTHNRARKSEVFCRVIPRRKGSQFPTLIFSLQPNQVEVIAEDWERGLKVLQTSRNGRLVLEGRALIESQTLERYLLEWDGVKYEEYRRMCFRVCRDESDKREILKPVVCE